MSEKNFRIVLSLVIAIWAIFVLAPSVADFVPRAWANVQYLLPGDKALVTITVHTGSDRTPVADARVQIITEQDSFSGVTDKKGQVIFESVPTGRAVKIRAQKLDFTVGAIANPVIPDRQRARFDLIVNSQVGQRVYVAHETTSSTLSFSMVDASSRIVLTPPGTSSAWENLPAGDVRISATTQRLYLLAANRLAVLNLADGSKAREDVQMQTIPGGIALDPDGEAVYALLAATGGRTRMLTGYVARTWTQRFSTQVNSNAASVVMVVSADGQRLFLAPVGEQTISVYNTRTGQRQATYPVGDSLVDIVIADDSRTLYALTARRQIPVAIDITTAGAGQVTPVLDSAPDNALSGATRILYTDNVTRRWLTLLQPASRITIIDLYGKTLHPVTVSRDPTAIIGLRYGDQAIVANRGGNSLSFVSLESKEVLDTIDVRSRPSILAQPQ